MGTTLVGSVDTVVRGSFLARILGGQVIGGVRHAT